MFFEANPYSVSDYSFSPAEIRGDSASVDVAFTVTSASGVERLQRTQEFVREGGDWRVVMRPEQLAAFTATDNSAEEDSVSAGPPKRSHPPQGSRSPKRKEGQARASLSPVQDKQQPSHSSLNLA
jgi:hypothetical protein